MTAFSVYNYTKSAALDYITFEIDFRIGAVVDTARITLPYTAVFDVLDNIQIKVDTTVVFDGFAIDEGNYTEDGIIELVVHGRPWEVMNKKISLDLTDTSPEAVIAAAMSGTGYTVTTHGATGINIERYSLLDKRSTALSEMVELSGWVLRFDHTSKILYFEPAGYLNSGYAWNSTTHPIKFSSWNPGDVTALRNRVRVVGDRVIPALTVADFQSGTATGTCTDPAYINDNNTTTYATFTLNQYAEIALGKHYTINQFRYFGDSVHNGDGYWKIQYKDSTGTWQDAVTAIPTRATADWSEWETFDDISTRYIRIVCTKTDSGSPRTRAREWELRGTTEIVDSYWAEAWNTASISAYGEYFERFRIDYLQTNAEAEDVATGLLVTTPRSSGSISTVWDLANYTDMVNETLTLTDTIRGLSNDDYVVWEQRVSSSGHMELQIGWIGMPGVLDRKRDEMRLRAERAQTIGISREERDIAVDVGDTDITNPGSRNSINPTGAQNSTEVTSVSNDPTDPGSQNSTEVTSVSNDPTDPGSQNSTEVTSVSNDPTDPGTKVDNDDVAPPVSTFTNTEKTVATRGSVGKTYSATSSLNYSFDTTGADRDDELYVAITLIVTGGWTTDPTMALIRYYVGDDTGGIAIWWTIVPVKPGQDNMKIHFTVPTPVLYALTGCSTITQQKIEFKILDGSGWGSVTARATSRVVLKHTHGATVSGDSHGHTHADPGHLHTITGDSHGHTHADPGHLHTITGDSHGHTHADPGHLHTITGDSHNHAITGDSHLHVVSGGGSGTVDVQKVGISKDDR